MSPFVNIFLSERAALLAVVVGAVETPVAEEEADVELEMEEEAEFVGEPEVPEVTEAVGSAVEEVDSDSEVEELLDTVEELELEAVLEELLPGSDENVMGPVPRLNES